MGIRDLKRFIKQRSLMSRKGMSSVKGYRVAVDISGLIYESLYVEVKDAIGNMVHKSGITSEYLEIDRSEIIDGVIHRILIFVGRLIRNGITPVLVFDGIPSPMKSATKGKRNANKAEIRDKIHELSKDRKELTKDEFELLKKLTRTNISPEIDEVERIRKFFADFGIPCLRAKNEAENLCASLCIEGKVYAVYSKDTDNIALLCPTVFFSMDQYGFESLDLVDVLQDLKLSRETLVDFCILCGCDYNDRIPGIGIKRAYDLMVLYGSIDNLPETYKKSKNSKSKGISLGRDCLKYKETRAEFSYKESWKISQDPLNLNLDFEIAEKNVKNHANFFDHIEYNPKFFIKNMKRVPKPEEFLKPKKKLKFTFVDHNPS